MIDNKNPLCSLCSVEYIKSNGIINTNIRVLCTFKDNDIFHHVCIIKYEVAPIIKSSNLFNLKLKNKLNIILSNMVKAGWSNSDDNIYKIIVIEFNEYGIRILSKSKPEFLEITSPKNYTNIKNYHFNQ